jgi:hypothetical protein
MELELGTVFSDGFATEASTDTDPCPHRDVARTEYLDFLH